MRRLMLIGLHAIGLCAAPVAQDREVQATISFEAASVKPNTSGENNLNVGPRPGGRFIAINTPVALLVTMAYQLQSFQVHGLPGWTQTERFDIVAKLDGDATPPPVDATGPDRMMLALRTLLADRFALETHWETQQLPIYALVLARDDGKLGPDMRPASGDCVAVRAAALKAAREGTVNSPNTRDRVVCGARNSNGRFQFGGDPLTVFANALANQVGRVVIDRTGLAGNWDFEFTFTPERVRQQVLAGGAAPDVDPNAPSLFTAIQDQLGLKLESTKGPVKVLVIDRLERPSPD
jgi:uncharacterized protein (TIGR03435 family)